MTQDKPEWEKELDKQLDTRPGVKLGITATVYPDNLKKFIHTLLQEQRLRVVEEAVGVVEKAIDREIALGRLGDYGHIVEAIRAIGKKGEGE